jgi:hypothetical protein
MPRTAHAARRMRRAPGRPPQARTQQLQEHGKGHGLDIGCGRGRGTGTEPWNALALACAWVRRYIILPQTIAVSVYLVVYKVPVHGCMAGGWSLSTSDCPL